ncbi:MAG: hypothetical protein KKF41_06010 [Actinobacteria bacterium]|nr:hypothetical protein [Actinomycetota bacterium]MBU1944814.1 hypothetical protein [Actinomycetota bacterium]MBU2687119.1 hypothetical protein [Actinomycetota bacterium]
MPGADTTTIEGPVSLAVTREIRPEAREPYERWLERLGTAARGVDPNLGMTVIKPGGEQSSQYVTILHFSSYEKLGEWERCDVRRQFLEEAKRFEEGKASFKEVTGFEYWFSLPKIAATRPPARYKMMLVTVIGLYILSVSYTYTINVWLKDLPDHLGIVIRILVLVLVMTYAVMPLLSRIFARWLYPRESRAA